MEIRFDDLQVLRGGTRAVRGASGAFADRAWTGVIGANGSGKTSLLRAIAGRLPAASGRIEAGAQDRTGDRIWRATTIGFAPETSALPGGLSGREYLGLIQRGPGSDRDREHLLPLRTALAFDPFVDHPIAALSAGMRQRIAIYAAFADLAETVILDEPFNWLDPVCAFETKEALRGLVEAGRLTLITALHEMASLTTYCDSGLLMSEGIILRELSLSELRDGAADIAAFEALLIRQLRMSADGGSVAS